MATVGCFSNYLENQVLNREFRGTSPVYLALFTSVPTDVAPGVEATLMTQYERQLITFYEAAEGFIINDITCDFGVVTGAGCTITHWGIFDSPDTNGGTMLAYGDFDPPQTVSVWNNVVVPAGYIKISLD
jgi:hypothetical protein